MFEALHKRSGGGLDWWRWLDIFTLPLNWFGWLVFREAEEAGTWFEGWLDSRMVMTPHIDGDASPLGERPLSVLLVVNQPWAAVRVGRCSDWVSSWLLPSVFLCGRWSRCSQGLVHNCFRKRGVFVWDCGYPCPYLSG